ncbi:hypothetical protein [Streptomyces sp. V3I7]|uniref:hypothetical protein n=1 Tax=Streptomyces sp. V3I7 TaxID=3042278 RepID=UPI002786CEFE|nr:hypothetical protein [Streptomyces sp. V3I7]MDQ0994560.1 hypothetical protein [Streptomyces sp. V3I7]
MSNSATDRPMLPGTVWPARGRHLGPDPTDVLRKNLRRLKDDGTLDDFAELGDDQSRVFEARWRVGGDAEDVTVRARLTLVAPQEQEKGHEWLLVAEAERPWNDEWPSPATMFWPADDEAAWNHHPAVAGLRLGDVNRLPDDEKVLRRLFRDATRESWAVNVVVHEAMTPDEHGRRPLARLLPVGLRHRVVEHRATPQQLRAVNWALRDLDVEVPRGGAVILPPRPTPSGYDSWAHSVRSVFLDGSEPAELIDVLRRFTALSTPMPEGAEDALNALREQWTLMTIEEELAHERRLVAQYAEALEAMTRSRDLYREAAESAHEALAAYRDTPLPAAEPRDASRPATSPLQQLTRTFERLKGASRRTP